MDSEIVAILTEIRRYDEVSLTEKHLGRLFDILSVLILDDEWPDDFFGAIVALQRDENFRRLKSSWLVLFFLSESWEQLSSEQKEFLRVVLADGFDKYGDWMGAFVTAEILGQRYNDEAALKSLVILGEKADLPFRSAVPYGLELIARHANGVQLRKSAVGQIQALERDASEAVRQEAKLAMKKLQRRGPKI